MVQYKIAYMKVHVKPCYALPLWIFLNEKETHLKYKSCNCGGREGDGGENEGAQSERLI